LIRHLHRTVPQKYHAILTPDYSVGCKRRVFDSAWFPGLNDPKIELTTQPLTSVHPRSVKLGPGQSYPKESDAPQREIAADVIILANGFEVERWGHPLSVVGRDGKEMLEVMEERGGPQAYQGTPQYGTGPYISDPGD
jgi:cation diffusion facilitator CzcD-associated flavoprotein CzcO